VHYLRRLDESSISYAISLLLTPFLTSIILYFMSALPSLGTKGTLPYRATEDSDDETLTLGTL
jgi:D-alanyl-D-alanine carboxypeptidase